MEIFQDLIISADAARMAAGAEKIEGSLPTGWTRDRAAEEKARAASVLVPRFTFCFACTNQGTRPAALLSLTQKNPGTFYVSNIIPTERHQLSPAEYNLILEDFLQRVFRPYAEKNGLIFQMTEAEAELEHWMQGQTAEKLRRFLAFANKKTGSSHPNDRERWNEFVLSSHREGSKLDSATLQRWLVEVEDWPPEVAEQLATEYDYGRELLAFAQRERQSA